MLRTVLTMSFYGSLAGLAALALSLGMRHIRASRGWFWQCGPWPDCGCCVRWS